MLVMVNVCDDALEKVYGGGSVSVTVVNALTDIIRILYNAGHAVGSSARRIKEDNLCPLN